MTAKPRLHNISLFHYEQPSVRVSSLPATNRCLLAVGPVDLYFNTLADLAELSDCISVAVTNAMIESLEADLTTRLRTSRTSERIAMQSADEWNAS